MIEIIIYKSLQAYNIPLSFFSNYIRDHKLAFFVNLHRIFMRIDEVHRRHSGFGIFASAEVDLCSEILMKCEMQIALFNRKYGCKWNVVLIQFKLVEYKLH